MLMTNAFYYRTVLVDNFLKREPRKVYVPYLEIPISTRCNLNCKYCSNLMQYYDKQEDFSIELIKREINELMRVTDHVSTVSIIGGEPFICKGLTEILIHLRQYKQIDEIRIASNAMVRIRDRELIKALRYDDRIFLSLSDYELKDIKPFVEDVENWGVAYQCIVEKIWNDFGRLNKRGRTKKQLKQQFISCGMICRTILDGKLYFCPRSGHGRRLNLIPCEENEYLDFFEHKVTKGEFKRFYFRHVPVTACDYCDYGINNEGTIVPAGKDQLKRGWFKNADIDSEEARQEIYSNSSR